jgi:hypothetical protein
MVFVNLGFLLLELYFCFLISEFFVRRMIGESCSNDKQILPHLTKIKVKAISIYKEQSTVELTKRNS